MGQYVGLDVSLETTKVHVLDEQGKRVGTCVSHPAAIESAMHSGIVTPTVSHVPRTPASHNS